MSFKPFRHSEPECQPWVSLGKQSRPRMRWVGGSASACPVPYDIGRPPSSWLRAADALADGRILERQAAIVVDVVSIGRCIVDDCAVSEGGRAPTKLTMPPPIPASLSVMVLFLMVSSPWL